MTGPRPYRTTLIASLLLTVALFFLHQIDRFEPHLVFSIVVMVLFIGLTVAGLYFADLAARNANRNRYLQVFMGFMMAKLFGSILIIVVYFMGFKPENRYFVLPFLLIYLVYSGIETYYFMKIGRKKV